MPIIKKSTYITPIIFRNAHLQTVYPSYFRKVKGVIYRRERVDMPDNDFIDIDWSETGSDNLVILSHGLEGDSTRPYMLGMIKAFNRRNWDGVSFNFRGCSGEMNRTVRFYHGGTTEDLDMVIYHIIKKYHYKRIALVGFSLGGNLTLKYVGEKGNDIIPQIHSAAAVSVPCDLRASAMKLARGTSRIYMKHLLKKLHEKIKSKMALMPGEINDAGFKKIKTFEHFDGRYIAPVYGFRDAFDYWKQCSSKQFIKYITIPTLIINAKDDPFLDNDCFPVNEARNSKSVYLEIPLHGGHVGFNSMGKREEYWHESRVSRFIADGEAI